MNSKIRIIISGKVQCVGMRYEASRKAESLKLKGFVKNLRDGTVEIVSEGEEDSLKKLLNWLKNSSPGEIKTIKKEFIASGDKYNNFEILY